MEQAEEQAQVPKHVIDKAIDKAKVAEMKRSCKGVMRLLDQVWISMVIAETLTSNVNRTIANIRTIFNKRREYRSGRCF
ncbi:YebC/PmpR family DNA-binding transcriptional regulator [Salmonella enterica subsp. enterica]|nr:YebC/PmpR family DNA-binding transcriptional regulator [Salmonella enterica subsp. enterica]